MEVVHLGGKGLSVGQYGKETGESLRTAAMVSDWTFIYFIFSHWIQCRTHTLAASIGHILQGYPTQGLWKLM